LQGGIGRLVLLYYFDLAGVAVFAASGVLAARERDLDVFGVLVVATVTAVGGGTLRDVLLDRHPIFWISDTWYLMVIIAAALATVAYLRVRPPPGATLVVADALGLALSGAQVAEAAQCPPLIVVVMGTMTGVTGGVLRDILTAQVPLILRREIYATAAVAGVAAYLVLRAFDVPATASVGAGMIVVVALRLLAIRWDLHLPVIRRR
jgi:uncharacterized membrane protein YeiH